MKYSAFALLLSAIAMVSALVWYWPPGDIGLSGTAMTGAGGRNVNDVMTLTRQVTVDEAAAQALNNAMRDLELISAASWRSDSMPLAASIIEADQQVPGVTARSVSLPPGVSRTDALIETAPATARPPSAPGTRGGAAATARATNQAGQAGAPATGVANNTAPGATALGNTALGNTAQGNTAAAAAAAAGVPGSPVWNMPGINPPGLNPSGINPAGVNPADTSAGQQATASSWLPGADLFYGYRVSMIYVSPDRRFAVIDGLFRREGDVLTTGARISQIQPGGVQLTHDGAEQPYWVGITQN